MRKDLVEFLGSVLAFISTVLSISHESLVLIKGLLIKH